MESLFAQELRRRGIADSDPDSVEEPEPQAMPNIRTKPRPLAPPPPWVPTELDGQRERSVAMVTEGLEVRSMVEGPREGLVGVRWWWRGRPGPWGGLVGVRWWRGGPESCEGLVGVRP